MPARRTPKVETVCVSLTCQHWETLCQCAAEASRARKPLFQFHRLAAVIPSIQAAMAGWRAGVTVSVDLTPQDAALLAEAALWAIGKVDRAREAGKALVMALSREEFGGR